MTVSFATVELRLIGRERRSHAHDHFQVVWGYQGHLDIEVEGRAAALQPGRVIVIAPGERHAFAAAAEALCLVVDSHEPAHREALSPLTGPIAGGVRASHPSTLHLMHYVATQPVVRPSAIELLIASLASSAPLRPRGLRRHIDWPALEAWIDARLDEPLSVAALAVTMNLSVPQFALRCRAELGCSPMTLVRRRRLAAARRRIDAGMPVYQAAFECGYQSPSALTAALRRETFET